MAVLQICVAVCDICMCFGTRPSSATEPIHRTYSRELKSRRRRKKTKRKRSSRSFIFWCEWKRRQTADWTPKLPRNWGSFTLDFICFQTEYIRTHESTTIVNRNRNVTRLTTYTVSEAALESCQIKVNRKKNENKWSSGWNRAQSRTKSGKTFRLSLLILNVNFPSSWVIFRFFERNKVLTIVAWKTHASLSRFFMFVDFLLFTFHRFIVIANCDGFFYYEKWAQATLQLERNIHNGMENGRKTEKLNAHNCCWFNFKMQPANTTRNPVPVD